MEQIIGHIERITFQNDETGFTVAQLQEAGRSETTCIVGSMPTLQPGETVRCFGEWKRHLIHGRQFTVSKYTTEAPADVIGIKKYLGSGLIKGIGRAYAGRIVEAFGTDTLRVIDETPERLQEIPGLGGKRIESIKLCWIEQKSIRDVMVFLQTYGVSPAYAQKIFKKYGADAIKKVKENPYNLAKEIHGIGFKTADTIAQKMGIAKDSKERIEAGIEYTLSELANDGHVCYPSDELATEAGKILECDSDRCTQSLDPLRQQERIEIFDLLDQRILRPFVWIRPLFIAEIGIARDINRLFKASCHLRGIDWAKALDWVQNKLNIRLAENQQKAVRMALEAKVQIITGGPGTGKSTITKAILAISEKLTSKILLAAPTGRAAKRMAEITGYKASTIHSLLEFNFKTGQFKHNRESPLDCELLIVDEASMIDTMLMYNLLKAIPNHARVIFVGDINQLPSVGPGNVLRDMISSNSIPVTMLTEIFRQAAGSQIITNAHKINNGIFPDIRNQNDSDFFFLESEAPEDVLQTIVALVSQRLPRKYGFDPLRDIQVLAPMKRGIIGTENLNTVLQNTLNPKEERLARGGRVFSEGDKVMQIRNNYQKDVFNGDIGTISAIHLVDQQLCVDFEGKEVIYDFSDIDELVLSYAVSVHKYQGSECPCVVMPVHTSHFMLLFKNLLYTGVTRGKKLVVLVGTKKALFLGIKNDEVKQRYTGLEQALVGSKPLSISAKL
jgi:exodeoxyribonuclease V alpha subunit